VSRPPPWATTIPSRLTRSARSGSASTNTSQACATGPGGGASAAAALARRGALERFAEMGLLPGLRKMPCQQRAGRLDARAKSSRSRRIESGTQLPIAASTPPQAQRSAPGRRHASPRCDGSVKSDDAFDGART
jgi:hypothetical protein